MSAVENHPHQPNVIPFIHDSRPAQIPQKSIDLADKILTDPKFSTLHQSGDKSIGFPAFKAASSIFKLAVERTQIIRKDH